MPTSLDFHFSLPFLSYLTIRALELPVTLPSLSEYVTPTATMPSSEVTASALNISVLPKLKTLLKPEDIEPVRTRVVPAGETMGLRVVKTAS